MRRVTSLMTHCVRLKGNPPPIDRYNSTNTTRILLKLHISDPELHAGRIDPHVWLGRVGSRNLQILVGRFQFS